MVAPVLFGPEPRDDPAGIIPELELLADADSCPTIEDLSRRGVDLDRRLHASFADVFQEGGELLGRQLG
jgi:hypothetical protein